MPKKRQKEKDMWNAILGARTVGTQALIRYSINKKEGFRINPRLIARIITDAINLHLK